MIADIIAQNEYDFLRTNPHLQGNILFLTLGGSHAYGTNIPTSDIDVRGVATLTKREILLGKGFEQVIDNATDTTIYSFDKIISLLINVNPNTIEMLGCKPEHYIIMHPLGKILLDNAHIFLSKRCVHSFGGYANQQLRRLSNKANRVMPQSEQEKHLLATIENASYNFKTTYFTYPEDAIKLYIDKSNNDDLDEEIFMDVNLRHYPLRDYKSMWSEMNTIVKEYHKFGHRNHVAIEHGKLAKHSMHLIRLYLMCIDILNEGKIITYREKDHDLLMDIRNGKYLDDDNQPTKEFMEMVDYYEREMDKAKEVSALPNHPDMKAIDDFVIMAHEMILDGDKNDN